MFWENKTNGFCLFNNVAVAAGYLLNVWWEKCKKVAIVDFDVHHGNGTEDLIECLQPPGKIFKWVSKNIVFGTTTQEKWIFKPWLNDNDAKNVLFISTHLHYQRPGDTFYPSTGSKIKNTTEDDDEIYPGGILNVPIPPNSTNI